MEQTRGPLLILGASARAAAQSALRAGYVPASCDLFADLDLQQIAAATRVTDYPRGVAAAAARCPPSCWLYTGGMENHPDLVDEIAARHRLLGVPGDVLRRVRDPFRLSAALAKRGLPCPRCESVSQRLTPDGSWLLKRVASAGGAGIRPWLGVPPRQAAEGKCWPEGYYLQQRVSGRACSAVYVAAEGRAVLLGVTEQLIGAPWCGGRGFQYCGSVGPLRPRSETADRFRRLGDCLAQDFSLVGLFGVDAVVNRRGVWPVEENPRYTASVEVLERAWRIPTIAWHDEACRAGRLSAAEAWLSRPPPADGAQTPWCGKAILFAREDIFIDERLGDLLAEQLVHPSGDRWPAAADLPAAGTLIAAHRPIMTVLVEGGSRPDVFRRLRAAAAAWQAEFGSSGPNVQPK